MTGLRKYFKRAIAASVLYLLFFANAATAEDFQFNGFFAQGIQQADNTNFIEDDGDASFALTELGVNGRWKISDRLSANGQVVYLNSGNRYPEGFRVDYLFLDWQAVRSIDWNLNVHLGRYKNYHWVYSATRDVPHTRPSNVLPQSIYFDSFRDVALGSDGLAIRANTSNASGDWEINWSYGSSPVASDSNRQLLGNAAVGDIKQDFVHQFSTYWHSIDTQWTFGFNLLDSDFEYTNSAVDPFVDGGATVQRVSLVGQYQSEFWEFTSEVMRERSTYNGFFFEGFVNDSTAEGGYAQITLLPTTEFNVLMRLDLYDLNNKDRKGEQIPALTGGQIPNYFGFMDTATLGLSYQISENLKVQSEFNRVRGAARLTPLLVREASTSTSEYWNMWSVQFMYWF
jgi:hypothetical protein